MTPRTRTILAALALALIAALAHAPALAAQFTWDDALLLTDNPLLRDAAGLRDIWFSGKATDYYPLTWTVLWLAQRVFGHEPLGYHALNIALHIAGSLLLWRVLRQLAVPWAWCAALLFAVHPVTVASVAWISQIKNTLSLLPYMAAALAYLRFDAARSSKWYLAALLLFAAALLCKSSTVVLPALLVMAIGWRHGRISRTDLLRLAPFLALAIAGSALAIVFQSQQAIVGSNPRPEGLLSRLAATGWVAWFYLVKALLPVKLMMVYPRWQVDERDIVAWLPLALGVALFAVLWWRRRTWGRAPLMALGCFVLALGPVLGLLNMYFARYSLVSDHLQYLALPAPLALLAAALSRLRRGAVLAVALAATFSVLTFLHARTFRDEPTMWAHNLRQDPQSWMAAHGVGRALAEQGRLEEAAAMFEQSLRYNPDYERAHVNLGRLRAGQGRMQEAVDHFARAVRIQPRYAAAQRYLAQALREQGDLQGATRHLQIVVQLRPDDDDSRYNLATLLIKQGHHAEAAEHLRVLLQRHPDDEQVRRLLQER